ncbi:MAG: ABC transporter ATP-binding protein, partial [Treponema sp.]|nr:ABC transporter ATP-binding protein [Treponema sp.]
TLEELSGCPFAHRCPHADARCKKEIPEWKTVADGHKVRCWLC